MENPYYNYFRETTGRGNGSYITGIGQIYTARRGVQKGYGYFVPGKPCGVKRGLGLGSALSSLFRIATPILKSFGKPLLANLGNQAVDVVSNIAKDALLGNNVSQATIKHGRAGIDNFVSKIPEAFSGLIHKKGVPESFLDSSNRAEEGDASFVPPLIKKRLKRKRVHPSYSVNKNKRLKVKYPTLNYM